MRGKLGCWAAAGLLAGVATGAWAQAGIYTCVDAKGRHLTSDRPIIDCIDREQTEMSPGGRVMRKIGPSMTAEERAREDDKQRRALEEKARLEDQKRRDRALITRFPDRATHDRERATSLRVVDDVIAAAARRLSELGTQRRKLDAELEFYKGDVKQAPAVVKRQIEENEQQSAAQKRFIANQEEEKKRVNARFDEELVRLKPLWAQRAAPGVTPTRVASAPSAAVAGPAK